MVVGFHEMVGRTIARLLRTPASHANTTAPAIRTFPRWTSGERRAAAQTAVFARREMTATTTAPIQPALQCNHPKPRHPRANMWQRK